MSGEGRANPRDEPSEIATSQEKTLLERGTISEQVLEKIADPSSKPLEQPKHHYLMSLILKFLEVPGQVLLVEGAPGTGKTSFALAILNAMDDAHKVYASSRVSPTKLRQHFPWIDEVIDSMSGRTSRASWLDELHDFRTAEPDSVLNKVLRLKHSRRRAVLVVDSWEGAVRNTKEDGRHMLESALLSELDESRVSIVIVTETEDHSNLDYLVDGIVTLTQSDLEGRRLRLVELKKLRGFRVSSLGGPFTLEKGRFNFIAPGPRNGFPKEQKELVPVVHHEKGYSTGIPDFDHILGGGIERGAQLLMDVSHDVPPHWTRTLLNIVRANFINQRGGCFIVPTGGYSSDSVAESLKPMIGEKRLDELVRIIEFSPNSQSKRWKIPVSSQLLADVSTFTKAWATMARNSAGTMLSLDLDKVVQAYGEDLALPGFTEIGEGMRDAGALLLSVSSSNSKLRTDTLKNADYHFRVENRSGYFLIYGIKPFTPVQGASVTFDKGYPAIDLTAFV